MLILILIDFQYSQNAVFSFEKGSNRLKHSYSGSLHPVKKCTPAPPPSKISDSSPTGRKGIYPTHYCYLENPDNCAKFSA